jgi:hypothetical protein
MKINKGKRIKPRRTLLYGVHGVGKSEWASQSPGCLFLNLEDGLNDIDCDSTDVLSTFDCVIDALRWLAEKDHPYKNICIDSIDWLESLAHKEVALKAGKDSIAEIGYGAGYKQAVALWNRVLFALEWLRTEKGVGVILLAHADIKKFQSPEQDSYDRYQPALHESASSLLQEWCDEVLFASYRIAVRKEDQGFDKTRNIAVDAGERYIRTTETAAVLAKNRLNMPPEIPFPRSGGWSEYSKYFPSGGNIDSVVENGSSKEKK